MIKAPCARLTIFMIPQTSEKPSATAAYSAPSSSQLTTTCPIRFSILLTKRKDALPYLCQFHRQGCSTLHPCRSCTGRFFARNQSQQPCHPSLRSRAGSERSEE